MNVLIVEDEVQIQSSLEDALRRIGIPDIRLAGNGKEALGLMDERKPDLILSDIRMPVMDGIALLEQVRSRYGDIPFIVLSGYDLFEYAQKALKLGAFSYLLKPVAENELATAVADAAQELKQKRNHLEDELQTRMKLKTGTAELRRHYMTEIAEGTAEADRMARKCEEYGIHLPQPFHCVWLAGIESAGRSPQHVSRADMDLLKYGLENLTLEVFRGHGFAAEAFRWDGGIGLALNGTYLDDKNRLSGVTERSEEAAELAASYLKLRVTAAFGAVRGRLADIPASYAEARRAYACKLTGGSGRVYAFEPGPYTGAQSAELGLSEERALLEMIEGYRSEEAYRFISERIAPFRVPCSFEIRDVTNLNYRLILLLASILRRLGFDADEALGDEYHLYTQVNGLADLDGMAAWFRERLDDLFLHIHEKSSRSTKKLMIKARDYITEHFHQAISLELVADRLQISPEYLSREFKKEHGENFTDFLLKLRMERAKLYIREGRHRTYEIAQLVGFQNEKYFSKVFKKATGFTPSEYKFRTL